MGKHLFWVPSSILVSAVALSEHTALRGHKQQRPAIRGWRQRLAGGTAVVVTTVILVSACRHVHNSSGGLGPETKSNGVSQMVKLRARAVLLYNHDDITGHRRGEGAFAGTGETWTHGE